MLIELVVSGWIRHASLPVDTGLCGLVAGVVDFRMKGLGFNLAGSW